MTEKEKKKIKVLVTGSGGFIGTHLMKELKSSDDYQLLGVDKKFSDSADITNFASLVRIINQLLGKPDYIIHLAGSCSTQKGIDEPNEDFKDNVIGTFNICEIARLSDAKVIYTSTCKVEPIKGQRTPYGLSKYIGEMYLEEYNKTYGVDYVINRPGTIYGPGQEGSPESGWLAWFIKASKENQPVTINGDGKQKRDVLWVKDYVRLLMDQLENFKKYKGEVYPVGGGEDNVLEIEETLKKHLKYKNYNKGPAREGDAKEYISDNKKVSKVNGWEPQVDWEDGLKLTLNAYKKGK